MVSLVYEIIEANGLPKCNSLATSLPTILREKLGG